MEQTNITLFKIDYPMGWSLEVYKRFKDLSGIDFNHLASKVLNEVNLIHSVVGKPPAYYSDIKPEDKHDYAIYYDKAEYVSALGDYNVTMNNEMTTRITEHVSLETAAKLFYCSAVALNSKVELAEFEDALFNESIKLTNSNQGYQYLVLQFITWVMNLGAEDDDTAKKPLKQSLFQKLILSLTT